MKVRNRNVATFYQIACIFNISELINFSLCYIERCFPIVYEKNNFQNLSFAVIAKVISSSELNIDSEIEVIIAINNWISYDFEERSKFASRLLSKVRLNLLSADTLNIILESDLSLIKNHDCVAILNDVSNNKISLQNATNRYCSQSMYNIILVGGIEYHPNGKKFSYVTKKIDSKNFSVVKDLSSIKIKRELHKSVYCKGVVYVFGGYDEHRQLVKSVEKYSFATNKWEIVSEIFDDSWFLCMSFYETNIYNWWL